MAYIVGRGRYARETYPRARATGPTGPTGPSEVNHQYSLNPTNIGPAATVAFDGPNFTTQTGNVRVTAGVSIQGAGGTGAPNDAIAYQLRQDGAAIAAPLFHNALGGDLESTANASGMVVEVTGLVPGSVHTFGIQAQDQTGGHTVIATSAYVAVEDF